MTTTSFAAQQCPRCSHTLTPADTTDLEFCHFCDYVFIAAKIWEALPSEIIKKRLKFHLQRSALVHSPNSFPCFKCGFPEEEIHFAGSSQIQVHGFGCPRCYSLAMKKEQYFDFQTFLQRTPSLVWGREPLKMISHPVSHFRVTPQDFGIGWSEEHFFKGGFKLIPALFGFPVERDEQVMEKPPLTTRVLLVTLLVNLYIFYFDPLFAEDLVLRGNEVMRFFGLNLMSYWFVHANWYHLIGNLYFLWMFGDNVEKDLGSKFLLILLVGGTFAGGLLQYLFTPNGEFVLAGASGGISALITYYVLKFPRAPLAQLFLFMWVRLPAYAFAIYWLGLQWVTLQSQLLGDTQVSGLAHAGGILVGFLMWFIWRPSPLSSSAPNPLD